MVIITPAVAVVVHIRDLTILQLEARGAQVAEVVVESTAVRRYTKVTEHPAQPILEVEVEVELDKTLEDLPAVVLEDLVLYLFDIPIHMQ